jgi:hypothetical protein
VRAGAIRKGDNRPRRASLRDEDRKPNFIVTCIRDAPLAERSGRIYPLHVPGHLIAMRYIELNIRIHFPATAFEDRVHD